MITEKMTRADVEAVLEDGGNFTKVGLAVFAENFFVYGYQNISKRYYREEMEGLLANLEMNARENGDEVCGAVMGKAVLLTFTRRQVVTDAISYLSRAAEKDVNGAAAALCAWYAKRISSNDLSNFENVDVGLDDCYDPTPDYPRQTFPRNVTECRRRLVHWLGKLSEEDFVAARTWFSVLLGTSIGIPASWTELVERLADYQDGSKVQERLRQAMAMMEGTTGADAKSQFAEGAKIVRELAEKFDCLDAWKCVLECHERGFGQFKTNKFRRDAKAAIARLEGK